MARSASSHDSRQLSWLLRHGAGEAGLAMDEAGWADVVDVLRITGMSFERLVEAVRTNDKGRLEVEGDRIRACQGHSLDAMPVTREALERSWERIEPDGALWHATSVDALAAILEEGLDPGGRSHVHLAASPDSTVGKRANVEVVVEVSPQRLAEAGLAVFRSPNGVVLVERVPADAIVAVHPVDDANGARRAAAPPPQPGDGAVNAGG